MFFEGSLFSTVRSAWKPSATLPVVSIFQIARRAQWLVRQGSGESSYLPAPLTRIPRSGQGPLLPNQCRKELCPHWRPNFATVPLQYSPPCPAQTGDRGVRTTSKSRESVSGPRDVLSSLRGAFHPRRP